MNIDSNKQITNWVDTLEMEEDIISKFAKQFDLNKQYLTLRHFIHSDNNEENWKAVAKVGQVSNDKAFDYELEFEYYHPGIARPKIFLLRFSSNGDGTTHLYAFDKGNECDLGVRLNDNFYINIDKNYRCSNLFDRYFQDSDNTIYYNDNDVQGETIKSCGFMVNKEKDSDIQRIWNKTNNELKNSTQYNNSYYSYLLDYSLNITFPVNYNDKPVIIYYYNEQKKQVDKNYILLGFNSDSSKGVNIPFYVDKDGNFALPNENGDMEKISIFTIEKECKDDDKKRKYYVLKKPNNKFQIIFREVEKVGGEKTMKEFDSFEECCDYFTSIGINNISYNKKNNTLSYEDKKCPCLNNNIKLNTALIDSLQTLFTQSNEVFEGREKQYISHKNNTFKCDLPKAKQRMFEIDSCSNKLIFNGWEGKFKCFNNNDFFKNNTEERINEIEKFIPKCLSTFISNIQPIVDKNKLKAKNRDNTDNTDSKVLTYSLREYKTNLDWQEGVEQKNLAENVRQSLWNYISSNPSVMFALGLDSINCTPDLINSLSVWVSKPNLKDNIREIQIFHPNSIYKNLLYKKEELKLKLKTLECLKKESNIINSNNINEIINNKLYTANDLKKQIDQLSNTDNIKSRKILDNFRELKKKSKMINNNYNKIRNDFNSLIQEIDEIYSFKKDREVNCNLTFEQFISKSETELEEEYNNILQMKDKERIEMKDNKSSQFNSLIQEIDEIYSFKKDREVNCNLTFEQFINDRKKRLEMEFDDIESNDNIDKLNLKLKVMDLFCATYDNVELGHIFNIKEIIEDENKKQHTSYKEYEPKIKELFGNVDNFCYDIIRDILICNNDEKLVQYEENKNKLLQPFISDIEEKQIRREIYEFEKNWNNYYKNKDQLYNLNKISDYYKIRSKGIKTSRQQANIIDTKVYAIKLQLNTSNNNVDSICKLLKEGTIPVINGNKEKYLRFIDEDTFHSKLIFNLKQLNNKRKMIVNGGGGGFTKKDDLTKYFISKISEAINLGNFDNFGNSTINSANKDFSDFGNSFFSTFINKVEFANSDTLRVTYNNGETVNISNISFDNLFDILEAPAESPDIIGIVMDYRNFISDYSDKCIENLNKILESMSPNFQQINKKCIECVQSKKEKYQKLFNIFKNFIVHRLYLDHKLKEKGEDIKHAFMDKEEYENCEDTFIKLVKKHRTNIQTRNESEIDTNNILELDNIVVDIDINYNKNIENYDKLIISLGIENKNPIKCEMDLSRLNEKGYIEGEINNLIETLAERRGKSIINDYEDTIRGIDNHNKLIEDLNNNEEIFNNEVVDSRLNDIINTLKSNLDTCIQYTGINDEQRNNIEFNRSKKCAKWLLEGIQNNSIIIKKCYKDKNIYEMQFQNNRTLRFTKHDIQDSSNLLNFIDFNKKQLELAREKSERLRLKDIELQIF